jgi:hypothetical protein
MSINISAAGGTIVEAVFNTATGTPSAQITFPNGVTLNASSSNLAASVQQILENENWDGTPFSIPDLELLRTFQADLPSVLDKISTVVPEPTVSTTTPLPAENTDTTDQKTPDEPPTSTTTPPPEDGVVIQKIPYSGEDSGLPENEPTSGTARDDDGNLMPGYKENVFTGKDEYAGSNYIDFSTRKLAEESRNRARAENEAAKKDWRFRISLARGDGFSYFYKISDSEIFATLLEPLKKTDGVIFPYTPSISMSYNANYEQIDLTHSNYKFQQYKNSEVGAITISADFTAQDTSEATYVLAMMHFFKSVTKMFYGNDNTAVVGLPPPLCYLHGYGPYQFDNHPVAIQSFSYTLPDDVDYIRTDTAPSKSLDRNFISQSPRIKSAVYNPGIDRLKSASLNKGGFQSAPVFKSLSDSTVTYVPTKLKISLICLPMMSRDDVSRNFSLSEYAKGTIYPGRKNRSGGGFW